VQREHGPPGVDHGGVDRVDTAVLDTRLAVFPLHGLDPHDPRD